MFIYSFTKSQQKSHQGFSVFEENLSESGFFFSNWVRSEGTRGPGGDEEDETLSFVLH